jgi:hypothetical protein
MFELQSLHGEIKRFTISSRILHFMPIEHCQNPLYKFVSAFMFQNKTSAIVQCDSKSNLYHILIK